MVTQKILERRRHKGYLTSNLTEIARDGDEKWNESKTTNQQTQQKCNPKQLCGNEKRKNLRKGQHTNARWGQVYKRWDEVYTINFKNTT